MGHSDNLIDLGLGWVDLVWVVPMVWVGLGGFVLGPDLVVVDHFDLCLWWWVDRVLIWLGCFTGRERNE